MAIHHLTRSTFIHARFSDGRLALAARPVVCGPNRQALHRVPAMVWTQDHTMRPGKLETDVLHLALGEPLPTTARDYAAAQAQHSRNTDVAVKSPEERLSYLEAEMQKLAQQSGAATPAGDGNDVLLPAAAQKPHFDAEALRDAWRLWGRVSFNFTVCGLPCIGSMVFLVLVTQAFCAGPGLLLPPVLKIPSLMLLGLTIWALGHICVDEVVDLLVDAQDAATGKPVACRSPAWDT